MPDFPYFTKNYEQKLIRFDCAIKKSLRNKVNCDRMVKLRVAAKSKKFRLVTELLRKSAA